VAARGSISAIFDAQDNEMTDMFHDTIAAALEQAEWEFGVDEQEWTMITDDQ
jgi:hypothetical protein